MTAACAAPAPGSQAGAEAGCTEALWRSAGRDVWVAYGAAAEADAGNRGWTANVGFVAHDAEGWLIGSGPGVAVAAELASALRCQLGARVTRLVSPRAAPQTVLGAAGWPGLPHHALPAVAQAMATRCPVCAAHLAERTGLAGPPRVALPDAALPAEPGPGLRFIALERAPGEWTTAVLRGDTLLAPGLVWGAGLLPDLHEAALPELITALERLRAFAPAVVVPEQGPIGDAGLIAKDLRYWQRLRAGICAALQAGHTLAEAELALAAWHADLGVAASPFHRERHALNLQRAWLGLEDAWLGDERPRTCPAAR